MGTISTKYFNDMVAGCSYLQVLVFLSIQSKKTVHYFYTTFFEKRSAQQRAKCLG